MTTLAELTTPMTVAEATTTIYEGLAIRGVKTTTWKPGAVTRSIVAVLAVILAAFSRLQANLARGGFLETSSGDWLTLVAYYVYGVTRAPGTFASGDVTFDNAGGGVFTGDAGDLIVRSSVTNKTYRNTASFSIGALATGVVIPFAAIEIGADSTAPALTIDELVTTLSGVTCSNAAALVGTDEENDPALRARCTAKLGSLSPRGASDAYDFFARSAVRTDGTNVGVTRVRTIPDGIGGVDVFVATATGGVTGTSGDPDTDLGAVAKSVWENAEPLAIDATIASASPISIAVTYEWRVRGADAPRVIDLEALPPLALAAYLAEVPIGGDGGLVKRSALAAVIAAQRSDTIDVVVTLPSADVVIGTSAAPVLGVVSPTVYVGDA